MTNTKKLIELLTDTLHEWECDVLPETISQIAEHLNNNGAIVAPCKVGDTVYVKSTAWNKHYHLCYQNIFIEKEYFIIAEVTSIIKTKNQLLIKLKTYNKNTFSPSRKKYPNSAFGKTVFLTKADIKQALNGKEVTQNE